MKRLVVLIWLFLIGVPVFVSGQCVRDVEGRLLKCPWAGGMNACQFGTLDLDGDGLDDLVVFDRHGGRISCFLNRGDRGEIRYDYAPEYASAFPELSDWVVFADYDGDGRNDLFTYSEGWAGIKVYRNVSADEVAFELTCYPYLTSLQGGGEVNILATYADYPAIVDLDGDGDLDILTFGVFGVFVEKHQNMSVERYGVLDSLVFERNDYCWGRVAESEEDNRMYLDTCLFGRMTLDPLRHRGATMAVRDLNGDGLPDVLLGDVDYPGLIYLQNGGTQQEALMVEQQTKWPQYQPVDLYSMPMPFFFDVNNDGADDMVVSPFDPNPLASEGSNSVWLYLNKGTDENPDFVLLTKSFLQDDMLDFGTGAYPSVADIDGDGLLDLLVGTIGDIDSVSYLYGSLQVHRSAQLYYYRNNGSVSSPVFVLEDDDFAHMRDLGRNGLIPALADLDNDGRLEMLVGTSEGAMMLYDADGRLLDSDYLHYGHQSSAPFFYDVDADGVVDLVVGNASGKVSYYQGELLGGRTLFHLVTEEWGEVDVRDYSSSYFGYSVPTLFKRGDKLYLSVGSEQGKLFLYEVSVSGTSFEEVSSRWEELAPDFLNDCGMRTASALADLNGDGRLELLVGNFTGGLQLYNASIEVNQDVADFGVKVSIHPNPVHSILTISTQCVIRKSIEIFDATGRCMIRKSVDSEKVDIDVRDWHSGLYWAVVHSESGCPLMMKFVKQ